MTYSVKNLDARFTITHGFDDITLKAKYIVKYDGRWVNSFPEREAAEYFAKMYAALVAK